MKEERLQALKELEAYIGYRFEDRGFSTTP